MAKSKATNNTRRDRRALSVYVSLAFADAALKAVEQISAEAVIMRFSLSDYLRHLIEVDLRARKLWPVPEA